MEARIADLAEQTLQLQEDLSRGLERQARDLSSSLEAFRGNSKSELAEIRASIESLAAELEQAERRFRDAAKEAAMRRAEEFASREAATEAVRQQARPTHLEDALRRQSLELEELKSQLSRHGDQHWSLASGFADDRARLDHEFKDLRRELSRLDRAVGTKNLDEWATSAAASVEAAFAAQGADGELSGLTAPGPPGPAMQEWRSALQDVSRQVEWSCENTRRSLVHTLEERRVGAESVMRSFEDKISHQLTDALNKAEEAVERSNSALKAAQLGPELAKEAEEASIRRLDAAVGSLRSDIAAIGAEAREATRSADALSQSALSQSRSDAGLRAQVQRVEQAYTEVQQDAAARVARTDEAARAALNEARKELRDALSRSAADSDERWARFETRVLEVQSGLSSVRDLESILQGRVHRLEEHCTHLQAKGARAEQDASWSLTTRAEALELRWKEFEKEVRRALGDMTGRLGREGVDARTRDSAAERLLEERVVQRCAAEARAVAGEARSELASFASRLRDTFLDEVQRSFSASKASEAAVHSRVEEAERAVRALRQQSQACEYKFAEAVRSIHQLSDNLVSGVGPEAARTASAEVLAALAAATDFGTGTVGWELAELRAAIVKIAQLVGAPLHQDLLSSTSTFQANATDALASEIERAWSQINPDGSTLVDLLGLKVDQRSVTGQLNARRPLPGGGGAPSRQRSPERTPVRPSPRAEAEDSLAAGSLSGGGVSTIRGLRTGCTACAKHAASQELSCQMPASGSKTLPPRPHSAERQYPPAAPLVKRPVRPLSARSARSAQ